MSKKETTSAEDVTRVPGFALISRRGINGNSEDVFSDVFMTPGKKAYFFKSGKVQVVYPKRMGEKNGHQYEGEEIELVAEMSEKTGALLVLHQEDSFALFIKKRFDGTVWGENYREVNTGKCRYGMVWGQDYFEANEVLDWLKLTRGNSGGV